MSILPGAERIRIVKVGTLSFSGKKNHLRQMPDPLLQTGNADKGPRDDALLRPEDVVSSSLAGDQAFIGWTAGKTTAKAKSRMIFSSHPE